LLVSFNNVKEIKIIKRGEIILQLTNLSPGSKGRVTGLTARDQQRRRLLDLGLIPGTLVTARRRSPSGDPTAFSIRGTILALRSEETNLIEIEEGD
jgi:ferrous iron transport protein A